jgi:ligand-binding sensor domain-containing protein
MLRKLSITGFLLLFLLPFSIKAQRFNFHNLGLDLPSECYCVLQDSKGYMWFSSEDGLYRYDGNSLKCFNTTNGLPDNNVFQLYEDLDGRMLFTTLVGKIGYIDHDSVIFPGFNRKLEGILGHGQGLVYDLYEDKNHILWIATYNGMFKTPRANDYSNIEKVSPPIDTCDAGTIIIDGKKALTSRLAPKKYIERMGRENYSNQAFFDFSGKVRTLQYGKNDVGIPSYRKVLLLGNGNILWSIGNCLYTISPDGSFSTKRFENKILCLYRDNTGGVWIGFWNNGLAYFNDESLNGKIIWSLKGHSVSNVEVDGEGGIWASTLDKNIFYAASKSVIDYSDNTDLDKKIEVISSMNNKILASSSGREIDVITDTDVQRISIPAQYSTEGTFAHFKYKDKIIVATSLWLMEIDTLFKTWALVKHNQVANAANSVLYDIAASPQNEIYGINNYQLCTIRNDSLKLLDFTPTRCRTIYINPGGEIFMGGSNGLYKYANKKFTNLGGHDSLLTHKIITIKGDKDSTMWIMTSSVGIILYKRGKVLRTISTRNGLSSNNVSDVTFDKEGNAWACTDNGVSKIYTSNGYKIENFNTRHGLISNEVIDAVIKNNQLWLGTGNGLCVMDIGSATINKVPPPVYVTSVYANEKPVEKQTDFKYGINSFRFTVNGLTFKDNKSRFIYRLDGLDTSWHSTNTTEISFNQLPAGSYTFEVKALNADNLFSSMPATYSFIIEKPFWLRWWFIVLEILFGAALTYLFIQLRLRTIMKKEEEKTRINKIIAEYEITALRTQMNPHFIFNAINSIQHYVLQNNGREAYNYLAKFSRLIRMMLNNAQEKKLTLRQELEMLELYIQLEQLRFSESFKFHLSVDDSIDTEQVFIPAMLIQPFVENAIWHGLMNLKDKSGAVLSININQNERMLKISIQDNGVGREHAKALQKGNTHRSVGMELTRKRTEVLSKMPGEEKVSIEIIDLYDQQNKPTGTRVDIIISNILS